MTAVSRVIGAIVEDGLCGRVGTALKPESDGPCVTGAGAVT